MNPYDSCVFNKSVDGVQITVCFHVDDLLMTSKSSALIDALSAHLQRSFTEVTFTRGAEHSFLSMTLECQKNGISVDMRGYVEKCLTDRKVANDNSPVATSCSRLMTRVPHCLMKTERFSTRIWQSN